MRLHRKKHLDERMAAVEDYILLHLDPVRDSRAVVDCEKVDFARVFGNDNPVALELGCGKGQWVCRMAQQNPDVNYVAVESMTNVIVVGAERAKRLGLTNVRFANCGVEYLPRYIPAHSVQTIHLNFSSPQPRSTYEKRRLTYKRFLDYYREWLKEEGRVIQKTDNRGFFEYSLCSMSAYGMRLERLSLDLHADTDIPNVTSEYEDKFAPYGPIYYVESVFPDKKAPQI